MTSLTNNTATVENAIDQVVSAIDDDTHGDSHVQTLLSAHRLFMDFHHDGTISAGKKHKKNKAALRSATKEAVALASYQSWIAGQHRIFLTACLEWLHFDHSRCQVTALRCLLKHCAPPLQARLDEALLSKTVVALMTEGRTSVELLAVLLTEVVFKYGDVALVTLHALRRALSGSRNEEGEGEGEGEEGEEEGEGEGERQDMDQEQPGSDEDAAEQVDVAHNVHAVLSRMPMPPTAAVLQCSMVKESSSAASTETFAAWSDAREHQKCYGKCWSTLLATPNLPKATYVKMLSQIPTLVLPHLSNPLILSDFLTDSYALGGEASLLALDSLWYLIRYHQFDCPQFYTKLYALLEPAAFHSVYRERLFEKVSMFLKSTGLSTHVISAFAKRTARLCLSAPPDGILYALPLIFRLIVRHPTCVVLLHRDNDAGSGLREDVVSDDEDGDGDGDGDEEMVDVSEMSEEDATRWRGRDTFRAGEPNPEKSGALGSSLWEIAALQHHYHPSVATMAKRFNSRLADVDMVEDFTGQSYDTLFRQSMMRRVKRVPLEFRKPRDFFVGR